jgi:hypothetical protein
MSQVRTDRCRMVRRRWKREVVKGRVCDVTSNEICNRNVLILRQYHEVLLPNPSEGVGRVVLVFG